MVADYSTNFQRYLESVCTDGKYRECQEFYTPTDAVECQPIQRQKFPLRLNLGLQVRTVVPQEQEGQASEKVEQLPVLEGLRKYQDNHVLLVGRPGSGKSTALQQLLWEEAQGIDLTPPAPLPLQGRGELDSPLLTGKLNSPLLAGEGLGERSTRGHAKIPVLVELRQYQTSVLDLIQEFLLRHELRLDIEDIKTLLIQGQFLLLLDGLNELPSVAGRELETFEQTYRQTAMIFTSRDVGRSLGRIKTLEMQPLNEVQMRQFVCTYLPESGEEMLRQLGSRLRELGQTPLLLWMLCSVYDEVARVPTNLGAAFRAFAEIYDNQLKANVPTYQESQYWWSRLLKHLAFKMLQGESLTEPYLTISKPEAERVLRDFLQGKVAYPDDCAVRWLEDLLKYHLLQRGTDNRIEFRHQLIQEYYAAEYLGERLADISNERLTWEYLNYLKWTQPLALMLTLIEDEAQAVRVVRLALEVDLQLGARFAWEVKREFQEQTVGFVRGLEIPQIFKVRLLGMTRSEFAITTLCHALDDEDSYVRQSAALALGEIGNPEAVAALIAALNYKDSDVCQSAALALGKIGNPEAVAALIEALNNQDSSVRRSAVNALRNISNPEAVTALIEALNDQDSSVRRSAVNALRNISNPEAVTALIEALNDQNSDVCQSAAEALGEIGNPEAVTALMEALNDKDSSVRWSAAEALGDMGNPEAIPALMEALNDKDSSVRWIVVYALGKIGNSEAITALMEALNDKDSEARGTAAYALGKIGDPSAVDALMVALNDENSAVRRSVAEALGEIGNPEAVVALIKALNDEDSWVRWSVAEALGKIANPEAITALIEALNDEDSWVRANAAEALGKIANPEAITALIEALNDEDSWVRANAAEALGKIGNAQLLPRFSKLLLTLATDKKYQLIWIIPEIQQRCRYYNYAIATSAPPQEQTTADPLSHSLNTLNQTLKTMSETPKYDFTGASFTSFGSVTGDIKGDNIIGIQHKYAPEQKQNLAEVAAEIHQLLDQLERNNPTTTEAQLIVNQAIERQPMLKEPQVIEQVIQSTPTLKKRLRSAGKAAYIEAVKVFLPPLGVAIEAINAWNNPED